MMTRWLALLSLLVAVGCTPRDPAPAEGAHDEHEGHEEHEGQEEHDEHEGHDEHDEAAEANTVVLSPGAAARVELITTPVEVRDLAGELVATAEVGFDEDHRVHITPRLAGRLVEVRATLGQTVAAGDVLAVLDSTEFGRAQAEYLQARTRVALAQDTLKREEKLAAEQLSAQREVAAARARAAEERSTLEAAAMTLHLYGMTPAAVAAIRPGQVETLMPLVSPLAGKVVHRHANRGELVGPGEGERGGAEDTLFIVADLSRVWVRLDIHERDLSRVHVDDTAAVQVDAWPEIFEGRISQLGDQVDPVTRTVAARIELPNPEGKLRPGMFARVRISDPHAAPAPNRPKSLVVPVAALLRSGEGFIVFVKTGERQYVRRAVHVIRRTADLAEIADGVQAGEAVVVRGGFILKSEAAKASMGGGHSH